MMSAACLFSKGVKASSLPDYAVEFIDPAVPLFVGSVVYPLLSVGSTRLVRDRVCAFAVRAAGLWLLELLFWSLRLLN